MELSTSREVFSGSSLLADWNLQSVSGLYKNSSRMSPSEFECLINVIGEKKILEKGHSVQESHFCSRKFGTDALFDGSADLFPQFLTFILLSNFVKIYWMFWVPNYLFSFINFDKFCDTFLSPLHFTITKTLNKPHSTTDLHQSFKQKHQEWKRRAEERTVVTCHAARHHLLRP